MPPDPTDRPKANELQFDKVVSVGSGAASGAKGAARDPLTCSACGKRIETSYFHVAGSPICAACKPQVEAQLAAAAARGRSGGAMLRASIFGLGAAIAGAIVYYAVIAITGWEIGIVAIVIGYMVGYSVRKGAGAGGRRFQILAVGLTYFAVGLAYTPLAVKEAMKGGSGSVAVREDSSAPSAGTARDSGAAGDSAGAREKSPSLPLALLMVAAFIVALPVLAIIGSMPTGLISALIIGIGMRQAWRMTAAVSLPITGPYKIGTAPASPSP